MGLKEKELKKKKKGVVVLRLKSNLRSGLLSNAFIMVLIMDRERKKLFFFLFFYYCYLRLLMMGFERSACLITN